MATKLIARTSDAALRQTIPPLFSFLYIRGLVLEHLGADAAAMLAEPQVVPGEGTHQWLIEAPLAAPTARLDQANPESAAAARATIADVRDRARATYESLAAAGTETSRQQAIAVLRAFEVPDDGEYVYLVEERPVLVGWGHVRANVALLEPAQLVLTYRRPATIAPLSSFRGPSSSPVMPPMAPPAVALGAGYGWLPMIFLWLLFVAAAVTVGARLLPGCSIGIPGGWRWTWTAACVARASVPLDRLTKQNAALEGGLRTLQIALKERDYCPKPAPPPPPPPKPDTQAKVACAARGCSHGRITATLLWHTADDLDLLAYCNIGGMQGAVSPLIQDRNEDAIGCGDGHRDIDSNDHMIHISDPAVENIFWNRNIPAGDYRLEVKASSTCSQRSNGLPCTPDSPDPIHFTVILDFFGKKQTCDGDVSWNGKGGWNMVVVHFNPSERAALPACEKTLIKQTPCVNCGKLIQQP